MPGSCPVCHCSCSALSCLPVLMSGHCPACRCSCQAVDVQEMMKSVGELMLDSNGRKVLTYLLVRRDQRFFCPDVAQVLQQGDSNPTRYGDGEDTSAFSDPTPPGMLMVKIPLLSVTPPHQVC